MKFFHIRKVSLETPKEGDKVSNANLIPGSGKGNGTKKLQRTFRRG